MNPAWALLRLASPQLPIGGYSYSQGLEMAVENGRVSSPATASRWISDQLLLSLEDLFSKQDEYQCCEIVAKKNLRILKGQTSAQKKKKLYDKLGRMGYPTEMVLEVIKSLILEEEPQELSADELAFEEQKLSEKLNRDYEKYLRVHRRKGAVGKELMFKIKKSLMGRGYPYALINEKLEARREELDE